MRGSVPLCSYKGGQPGFVRVVDQHTIAFPVDDGNGMFPSMGNVGVNPNVGILFIDFERGTRLRFNRVARIEEDDPLADGYPGAPETVEGEGMTRDFAPIYSMCTPDNARAITRRWISEVPSKSV